MRVESETRAAQISWAGRAFLGAALSIALVFLGDYFGLIWLYGLGFLLVVCFVVGGALVVLAGTVTTAKEIAASDATVESALRQARDLMHGRSKAPADEKPPPRD